MGAVTGPQGCGKQYLAQYVEVVGYQRIDRERRVDMAPDVLPLAERLASCAAANSVLFSYGSSVCASAISFSAASQSQSLKT